LEFDFGGLQSLAGFPEVALRSHFFRDCFAKVRLAETKSAALQKTFITSVTKNLFTKLNTLNNQKSNPGTRQLHFMKKEFFLSGLLARGLSNHYGSAETPAVHTRSRSF
jgi:hypothetical protein